MADEAQEPAVAEAATEPMHDAEAAEGELGWEAARLWLATLPRRRNVTVDEVEVWLEGNQDRLAREISSVPRRFVHDYLQKQHKIIRRGDETQPSQVLDPPLPRFKQSDKWKPVWAWLESLDGSSPIGAKEITEWLSLNPRVAFELEANHSRHNLFKYIQKCYYIVLKKKKKKGQSTWIDKRELSSQQGRSNWSRKKGVTNVSTPDKLNDNPQAGTSSSNKRAYSGTSLNSSEQPLKHARTSPELMNFPESKPESSDHGGILAFPADDDEENHLWTMDKEVVKRRYELLCQLQLRLRDLISKSKEPLRAGRSSNVSSERRRISSIKFAKRRSRQKLRNAWSRRRTVNAATSDSDQSKGAAGLHSQKTAEPSVNAWVCSQALTGYVDVKGASTLGFIRDRELGLNWGSASLQFKDIGNHRRNWSAVLKGWDSLERQFRGPGVRLQQKLCSSWIPTWSAYSSNVAVLQPTGRLDQGVQKVLDIRFHPSGIPQLVCGCNAAPNELLVYDLTSGRSKPLAGHNCQVQAVEYASEGSLVVSCANNIVKVWDSSTAACLYTLGPGSDEENSSGHKKKISAMAVNPLQSCLVATSGGQGDGQLLLWNVARGALVSDLNGSLRQERDLPSMDALEFCKDNLLICGSDSAYGGPAVIQFWDVDALKECATFPANATYITCLKTDPAGTTVVTGSGDGTVGLFDVRSCGGITRLPLGPNCEVTSVSFSSCGRYIQASSTANNAVVWDTRVMSMEPGPKPVEYPPALASSTSRPTRALHCLSHGKPMPTAENTCQRPGFVDVGDQGINDARWFSNSPILVSASGNGSIALWDVSLGQPCLRHIQSHSRCINTVAISPNDDYICTGGDDQKLVLYENVVDMRSRKWRLTHPLFEGFSSSND